MSKNSILLDQAIEFASKAIQLKNSLTNGSAIAIADELARYACLTGESVAVAAVDEFSIDSLKSALQNVLKAEYRLKLLLAANYLQDGEESRALNFACLHCYAGTAQTFGRAA